MKPITGTFIDEITYDIPSFNWGPEEWRTEFDSMRETGIDTVILIRAGMRDMASFPSEALGITDVPDLAQLFLDEALRCGMKFFFGTYDSQRLGTRWEYWEADWELNRKLLPEILRRYGDHPAFHGWYISPEHCMVTDGVLEMFRRHSEMMKELAPGKPVLISPFYPAFYFKDDTREERHRKFAADWSRIFAEAPAIDICAFQDGSCRPPGSLSPTEELADYIREITEVAREAKITLWNNVETFANDMPIKFPPIDWRIMKRKMEITDPFVEKHITFEFSHFMSPNSLYPAARTLHRRYMESIRGLSR